MRKWNGTNIYVVFIFSYQKTGSRKYFLDIAKDKDVTPVVQHKSLLPEVGKSDDIKSVNNIFVSPVSAWEEVGRLDCCMNYEKS